MHLLGWRQATLEGMAQPLEDLNENRLSKFEFALLLTKIMEVSLRAGPA